jgi:hypothetical protein
MEHEDLLVTIINAMNVSKELKANLLMDIKGNDIVSAEFGYDKDDFTKDLFSVRYKTLSGVIERKYKLALLKP